MTLVNVLAQKQVPLLKSWFNHILDSYPPETARLLKKEKNQFANPVGNTLHQGIEKMFRELVQDADPAILSASLGEVIRIRAVQEFSPAQALAFIFSLKGIVHEEITQELEEGVITPDELARFDATIDALGLLAFNTYMECREKIYELRVSEVNNRTARILQRLNKLHGNPEQESNLKECININPT
jgi:hypothetical protein